MKLERLLGILFIGILTGCGPTLSTQVRLEMQPFDANEFRQEKEGVIVENKEIKEFPATFFAEINKCNDKGGMFQHIKENVSFVAPGQFWYQVALTNKTGHVIRLNSTVIRLFDPAGNQTEPAQKDDLKAAFLGIYPCVQLQPGVINQFALIKMLDRNTEILPDTTVTGWLAFAPPSNQIPGIWKLAIYEVPVASNEAGQVTKTTRFELRGVLKKFVDTYQRDGMLSPKKLVESKEATD